MSNKTKDTLLEVRKAYRFLYQYQRKILDLMGYVGGTFGLNYNGGSPRFSNGSPRNGTGKLENWAWDWLSMYFYEFTFKSIKKGNDEYFLSINLVNDTGFFIANNKDRVNSRTRLSAFEDVEKSETKLIFFLSKNNRQDYWADWTSDEFVLEEKGVKIKDEKIAVLYKGYLLEDFDNEEKALSKLKDFESYCIENGLNFKIKERKFE